MVSRHRASLALNVVLILIAFVLLLNRSQRAPIQSAREAGSTRQTNGSGDAQVFSRPTLTRPAELVHPGVRQQWVAQLRAAGVPDRIIARVVLADLEDQWDKRLEELHGAPSDIAALRQEQERDAETQLRAALGEEAFKVWDQANMLREANIGKIQLSAFEADSIYDLKKKLQQKRWDLEEARLKGAMDDADIDDACGKAYSDFNQQMKSLLGEERYAKSQGVDDGTAVANLREDFVKANPSDSQFQELLRTQQQWNQHRSDLEKQYQNDPSSPVYAEQVKSLDAARDEEYQRVLGTNVFEALQKEQDIGYSKMKKYETIWGLDESKMDYVYGTVKYYEKSVQDYQGQARAIEAQGQTVDWDSVNKNLQQFAQQTRQALQTYLGPDRFNKMQRNGIFQFDPSTRRGPFP